MQNSLLAIPIPIQLNPVNTLTLSFLIYRTDSQNFSSKSRDHFPFLRSFQTIQPHNRPCVILNTCNIQWYSLFLDPSPQLLTPKVDDHSLAVVCDSLLNIFKATTHTSRPPSPSTI